MKLSGQQANQYLAAPDPKMAGLLIAGADPMRVAMKRQEALLAIVGPQGEAEMRLTRLPAADLRKDAAALSDAIRAQSFFPGPRAVFVEDATDGLAPLMTQVLADWRPGDASLVVTAGALTGKSALKKLFDGARNAVSIMFYDNPLGRDEIDAELARAGLTAIPDAAMGSLLGLAQTLDPGDFRQLLEKIALYKWGDTSPLRPDEIDALAPLTVEAEVDEVLAAVAEGRAKAVGGLVKRLEGQGVAPVTLCIGALRHFRTLHASVSGGNAFYGRNPRQEAMTRQAKAWGQVRLEKALAELVETDLTLRSSSRAPAMAVMERTLLRLAMTMMPR